ncbi:class I SAM-dependent methyltransferase [Rickettsiales endosymbiont of Stachyamoeba lipophora]|uniref:class I SAM-dependent methyltransferase n=1 Tax=Rickettsiales endosymbiont of Stachyamoeba lipophora TaxID=2486578 RepID=UPI000F64F7C6|nr:SAM-dependent methyltransferase [Rickettsiales endosymbiont of Stachyamoeba lipophora]AZL16045.1 hypothetical protein EF513_05795 [Rickettsiales endosymbiont of Stachyamoeba lipophora]
MFKLLDFIKQKIIQQGFITIDEYMSLCLYDPIYGYYSTKQPFGKSGDFITAPTTSQVFGELIGLFLLNTLACNQITNNINYIELGPGNGTLLSDILRSWGRFSNLANVTNFWLVENSLSLRLTQAENLKPYSLPTLQWFDNISDFKVQNQYVMLVANEFFDALPVKAFIKINGNWHEQILMLENDQIKITHLPIISGNSEYFNQNYCTAPNGAIIELNHNAGEIAKHIDGLVIENKGIAIIIDYGFVERKGKFVSTLQSLKKHKFVDNFQYPGEADITTHVDFVELSKNIINAKYHITTQEAFLKTLGVQARFEELKKKNPHLKEMLTRQYERLVSKSQMGELFKVLIIYHPELEILNSYKL